MSCDYERLAEVIYQEIEKQLPKRGISDNDHDLQAVLIDGQLDLLKIASSLTRRFCVLADNLETVITEGSPTGQSTSERLADRA